MARFRDYEDMVGSKAWASKLTSLNTHLHESLAAQGCEPALMGNLFYRHNDPGFVTAELDPTFEGKRRNFFALAQQSTRLLEVGVNGGHSLFLALMANPELTVVGIDIAQRLTASMSRVDIYVPAAFAWLEGNFPGRVEMITGNSLLELPRLALERPDDRFDWLHLDGAKDTHLREFLAIRPLLAPHAKIMLDDTNRRPVRISMRQILGLKMAQHVNYGEGPIRRVQGHRVLEML